MAPDGQVSTYALHKFDGTNFQVWKYQMKAVLHSHRLYGYVDGTKKEPTVPVPEAKTLENKKNRADWW